LETGDDIAADNAGNIYVTGRFSSSSITFGTTVLTNNNTSYADLFVAKYDTAGNVIWAKRAGGNRDDLGYGITCYGTDVYITGYFQSDSIAFGGTTLYSEAAGSQNLIIVKYASTGDVIWAKGVSTYWGSSIGYDIDHDSAGNIYIVGEFGGLHITFDSIVLNNIDNGSPDVFVVKYDPAGNPIIAEEYLWMIITMLLSLVFSKVISSYSEPIHLSVRIQVLRIFLL